MSERKTSRKKSGTVRLRLRFTTPGSALVYEDRGRIVIAVQGPCITRVEFKGDRLDYLVGALANICGYEASYPTHPSDVELRMTAQDGASFWMAAQGRTWSYLAEFNLAKEDTLDLLKYLAPRAGWELTEDGTAA